MPIALAAWGSKLVSVIPGIVFISNTYILLGACLMSLVSSRIISVLDIPEQPRILCAFKAISCIARIVSADKSGGVISWLAPGVYLEWKSKKEFRAHKMIGKYQCHKT